MTDDDSCGGGDDERNDEHRQLWLPASTIEALGELTAQWLEGKVQWLPGYLGAAPDPETTPLVADLAAFNRAGYWTTNSQPAEADDDYLQRAFVDGYCSNELMNAICAGCLDTELLVLAVPAVFDSWVQIPVSKSGTTECTWAGGSAGVEADQYGEELPNAAEAIRGSWSVSVIDPRWGRNDLLWPTVRRALVERPQRFKADYSDHGEEDPGCSFVAV